MIAPLENWLYSILHFYNDNCLQILINNSNISHVAIVTRCTTNKLFLEAFCEVNFSTYPSEVQDDIFKQCSVDSI